MRIVAGSFGGRRIRSPAGAGIRPTTDRVREAIFSIIAAHVREAHVLDLFAGTGALGLEALSRGASRAVFVDRSSEAVSLVRLNIELCGVKDRAIVIQGAVHESIRRLALKGELFSLIFMDPPYGKGYPEKEFELLGEVADSSALIVVEHHSKDVLAEECHGWRRVDERKYGDTAVSFYTKDLDASDAQTESEAEKE